MKDKVMFLWALIIFGLLATYHWYAGFSPIQIIRNGQYIIMFVLVIIIINEISKV
jgi:hypothetical protein